MNSVHAEDVGVPQFRKSKPWKAAKQSEEYLAKPSAEEEQVESDHGPVETDLKRHFTVFPNCLLG